MFGSFGAANGVYSAYHINKVHWISMLLPDAANDLVEFLVNASYEATKDKKKSRKTAEACVIVIKNLTRFMLDFPPIL